MPFWSDNNICFLAGKGDGNIRYYELENDELHYLTEYKSTEPQRGLTFVPRRALNADENEVSGRGRWRGEEGWRGSGGEKMAAADDAHLPTRSHARTR
jgi:hypothetical protein